jgi:alpha-beta hydrolase superfamily lysophospholipase
VRRVAAVALSAGLAAALQAAAAVSAPAALAPLALAPLASAPPASAAPKTVPAPSSPQAGAAGAPARASDTAQSPPAAAGDAAPAPAPAPVAVEVTRGWLDNGRGDRLRTVLSRPRKAAGKLPALLLVGWLSCDSVAPGKSAETDIVLLDELAVRSGAVMLRVEKPGVGGSQGTACAEADFQRELAGYRAGLRLLKATAGVDPAQVFLLGISNGAGVAPLVAEGEKVAGYVVAGGWVKTWYEHMLENERRRLRLAGHAPGEVNERLKLAAQFYDLYLNGGKTPGEVLRLRPDLAPVWEGDKDLAHQYGRPAAFYIQLQQLNLAAAWSHVREPVLVIHGEYDWIMSREDHELIAAIVNRNRPGAASFVEVPQMDHLFGRHGSAEAAFRKMGEGELAGDVLELILGWLRAWEKAAGGS